ncbi:integral membrane protein [Fusarium langsethiae]|uniref:Integral membrane protein n=1 Tax=Fusarium langsethiae TaxID=179993 RepID=A0A0M9EUD2_FUSLA|nr:integral membrane protein [Fusarium langsethiae]GKU04340.1 unnamed protein product [Fusarium langsethiae]GKU19763.1 unnamed protein product [Fusarium langsethiae]
MSIYSADNIVARYGAGYHAWEIRKPEYYNWLKWFYASTVVYIPASFFTKATILLLMARVFAVEPRVSKGIRIFTWALLVAYVPIQILRIVNCYPIRTYWDPKVRNAHCLNQRKIFFSDLSLSIVTDLLILLVPIPLTWRLNLSVGKRIKIVLLLGAGGIATALTLFRVAKAVDFLNSDDITVDYTPIAILTLVYGGFITDLRGDIRRFYDIDGNENRDCFAGCCKPCCTLVQVENEIMGQEKCRKPSDASGYISHPPMSSSSSSSSSSSYCSSKSPSPDPEHDECLPCIPEDQSEKCPSTPSSRRSSKKRQTSIALDPVAPTDATLVRNHDLGNDPRGSTLHLHGNHRLSKDATIASYPPSIHQLRTDTKAPASPPAVLRHDLFDDAKTSAVQRNNHDLGFDQVNTYRANPEHQIHQDETVPGAFPTSSHNLGQDLTSNQVRSAQPHGLEEDDEVASRPTNRGLHHLDEDK